MVLGCIFRHGTVNPTLRVWVSVTSWGSSGQLANDKLPFPGSMRWSCSERGEYSLVSIGLQLRVLKVRLRMSEGRTQCNKAWKAHPAPAAQAHNMRPRGREKSEGTSLDVLIPPADPLQPLALRLGLLVPELSISVQGTSMT